MKVLIKNATIIDSLSKFNNKVNDILINNNRIEKIAKSITIDSDTKIFKAENLHVSKGWFDLHVNFGQPGYEQKETLKNGVKSASAGGFTEVMLMPNTKPHLDNSTMIEYIINYTKDDIVNVYPAGNLTKLQEGKNIVEMHDMINSGCLAFTDDKKSIQNNELMKIALLYLRDTNKIIMHYPNDLSLQNHGVMNEGNISTMLGLKGIPSLAEEMMVDRDLNICDYTESKVHLSYLSTKKSISKIRKAKEEKLNISCDVALHNIFLTENKLNNFDSRFKVLPPLRTNEDNQAIIDGLKDGTIDVITSDHAPQENENKKIEFDNAEFGIIGLETAFGLINKNLEEHLSLHEIIDKISTNPRKVLGIDQNIIEEGSIANLTLFDPKKEWEFKESDIQSKSKNSPFIGDQLKGKALAIYNNNQFLEI
jgi:dihydroorotase|tara:strand:- start:6130 stop:7398 length:1269 start_codon:yes stop_codon:yes gene_type:complete